MSLAHIVIGSSPTRCCCFSNGLTGERRRTHTQADVVSRAGKGRGNLLHFEGKLGNNCKNVAGLASSKVNGVATTVENGQLATPTVEIPVTCYQILGVSEKAEKDEIVKTVMELKNSEIEEGYTADLPTTRQDLLMDVRDKLLFEPEYVGNKKENIQPRTLCIPWAWLPASLCILQEVGEAKLVLEIGHAALQRRDSKPYIHDILLSMALSECSIAKIGFERKKVSEAFEALAQAQHLLRGKSSLVKIPLLRQIEESLEEFAPACTLELLALTPTSDKSERRRGAMGALRELLRQGLDADPSCQVQDWPYFFRQALSRLTANEIVELLYWDTLAVTRKNRKSLESQTQRTVIDFDCFYLAMLAHIAFGFSTRRADMISKGKTMCECLASCEGVDLKFEGSLCSFLLGQESASVTFEKLQQLNTNGSSTNPKSFEPDKIKADKGKESINHSLELWLKDSVLSLFPDTRDCSLSLASYFGGPRRILNHTPNLGAGKVASSPFNPLSENRTAEKASLHPISIKHLGEAVKQLAPASLEKSSAGVAPSPTLFKRNPELQQMGDWLGAVQKLAYSTLLGCVIFTGFKILGGQFGRVNPTKFPFKHQHENSTSAVSVASPSSISSDVWNRLGKVAAILSIKSNQSRQNFGTDGKFEDLLMCRKREMAVEEAEELIKLWQDIKAEALGPRHQISPLPSVLDESMLEKWKEIAILAKEESIYWRIVLVRASVLHAEITSGEIGPETAEIEALLEEAAELIDESEPDKASYYSTYKVRYMLKRQADRSWRICFGAVEDLE